MSSLSYYQLIPHNDIARLGFINFVQNCVFSGVIEIELYEWKMPLLELLYESLIN